MPSKDQEKMIRVKESKIIGTFGGSFVAERVIDVEKVEDGQEIVDNSTPLSDWVEVTK